MTRDMITDAWRASADATKLRHATAVPDSVILSVSGPEPGDKCSQGAKAALPIPESAANDPSTNAGKTVEQLRAQLDQTMKAEG